MNNFNLTGTILSITGAEEDSDQVTIVTTDGTCTMNAIHDCCNHVRVAEIHGDVADMIGKLIVRAEEVSNADGPTPEDPDSFTWTFYHIRTTGGDLTLRWLGESNGYYCEGVDCTWTATCN